MSRRTKPKPRECPNGIASHQYVDNGMRWTCKAGGRSSWSVICANACNPECPDCKENHVTEESEDSHVEEANEADNEVEEMRAAAEDSYADVEEEMKRLGI